MFELLVKGTTLPEAYHNALVALHENNNELACPDYNTRQKEASMTFVVEEPLNEPMISKLFIGGPRELEQYRQEMLDGILDFEVAKGNWAYTYHQRIEKQIPWLIDELKRNPDTRRAILIVRDWEYDITSDSPACLQLLQFLIRNNKLHLKIVMRSNDAAKATFMNAFAFIMLQKRVAEAVNVSVGTYTHRSHSFHVYENDYKLFDSYVKKIKENNLEDVTYEYIGEWDEMMDDAKPEIAKMVEELRER